MRILLTKTFHHQQQFKDMDKRPASFRTYLVIQIVLTFICQNFEWKYVLGKFLSDWCCNILPYFIHIVSNRLLYLSEKTLWELKIFCLGATYMSSSKSLPKLSSPDTSSRAVFVLVFFFFFFASLLAVWLFLLDSFFNSNSCIRAYSNIPCCRQCNNSPHVAPCIPLLLSQNWMSCHTFLQLGCLVRLKVAI